MKVGLVTFVLVVFAAFSSAAVSIEEVVKLSKLKTSDELILRLIQKEGIDRAITSRDVVYLKQQGVSEQVITYLLQLSNSKKGKLPAQQQKSEWISENLRRYTTTTKDGKEIKVVTNLDENGKRIGGDLPPQPPRAEPELAYPAQEPREIVVYVRPEESDRDRYREDYRDEDYVQEIPTYGMPLYNTYFPYSTPYYPYAFPYRSPHHSSKHFRSFHRDSFHRDSFHRNFSHHNFFPKTWADGRVNRNLVQPRTIAPQNSSRSPSSGTRSFKR